MKKGLAGMKPRTQMNQLALEIKRGSSFSGTIEMRVKARKGETLSANKLVDKWEELRESWDKLYFFCEI